MDNGQFLLLKLMEECAEVAHRACKQIQFGRDEVQAGQDQTNGQRLRAELNDLMAMTRLLVENGEVAGINPDQFPAIVENKMARIAKYKKLSVELGRL